MYALYSLEHIAVYDVTVLNYDFRNFISIDRNIAADDTIENPEYFKVTRDSTERNGDFSVKTGLKLLPCKSSSESSLEFKNDLLNDLKFH